MLHGEVKVNHAVVMEYKIQNIATGDLNTYQVDVRGYDNHGYPYNQQFEIQARGTAAHVVAHAMIEVDRRLTHA